MDCVQKVNYNQHNSGKETQLVIFLLEEHGKLRFGYLDTNSGCGMSEISIKVTRNRLMSCDSQLNNTDTKYKLISTERQ